MRLIISTLLFFVFSTLAFGQKTVTTVDSLKIVLKNYPDLNEDRVDALNDLGYRYWIVDSNESEKYGIEALQLAKEINYNEGMAMAKRVLGVAYWTQGRLKLALENLTSAQSIYEIINKDEGVANCLMNTGMVYADIGDYDKALDIYYQSIEKFTKLNLTSRIATTFNKIGAAHTQKKQYSKAKDYLVDAIEMHSQDDFFYGMAEAHNELGKIFLFENQLGQADYHLKKAVNLGKKVNDEDGLLGNKIQMGKLQRLRKNYAESERYLNEALLLAKKKKLRKYILEAYAQLKLLKKDEGKFEESLEYYNDFIILKDSIYNTEKSKQIAALEFSNELADKEKEIALLQEKERNNTIIKWSFASGSVAIAIIGFLVFKNQQQKRAKKREMYKRKQEIKESEEELAKTELENARLKQKEMAQQLEFRNKELTSYALNFAQKNELLTHLEEKIALAKKATPTEQFRILGELHRDIKQHVNIDSDWEDFKRYFEEVHTDFHSNLKQEHPDLTSNDLKICSLTRLNLNIKETANILGISPESAKTARYRLRKKLNLSPDKELLDYFLQLENN
ncbi:hypothetical protein HME9304_02013 [Flagellimonas maritima]|uniref:HTH luxR-type domain-containing protein n=1 Tax=Flagellimonas maritima TaxID=1383885 RepID=A0A2Z4LSX1_9FLAO|nr:tetratricopeptide repeat protein [Allomuricauda aurantiaca]AWX45005.1 hypothetical protein HME9304_02013 [Allomuricauda aurantiaca]